jgi:hypothetical protein
MKGLKRVFVVATATVMLLLIATGPALAHFCYNASRSEQGNRGAAASQGWFTLEQLLTEFGLCPEGIDHFLDNVAGTGLPPDVVIHGRAVLANGRLRNPNVDKLIGKSINGKGIDHLIAVDWNEVDNLLDDAFALCFE